MQEGYKKGSLHPLTLIMNEAVTIFKEMGFVVEQGPELEDEWHNFDALNFPKNHPARDMQDTFFIKNRPGMVLRTHTSNTQIRFMENMVANGFWKVWDCGMYKWGIVV
jgi:phenylalanyl-tRNA synthetase alpha chain